MGASESASLTDNSIPVRRRAHTAYARPRPDYFGQHNNNNNNNDEKQKNSNGFLTEFDVKQMMARSRAGTICVSSMRSSSDERAEELIIEAVRQSDGDHDEVGSSSGIAKKGSISSRKSVGSHDSGVGTHSSSPVASNLHLPVEELVVPGKSTTVSISGDTLPVEEEKKKRNIKRAIMKKVFRKKPSKFQEMRTRSKSLGANVLFKGKARLAPDFRYCAFVD